MRLKITEGVNKVNGKPIFYLYQDKAGDGKIWNLIHGCSDEKEAREIANRILNHAPEKVIAEFEA